MNYTPFMSVFDVHPPIINNKHLIIWLKINFSFLRNKLVKIKPLDSERDINFIIFVKKYSAYSPPSLSITDTKKAQTTLFLFLKYSCYNIF